MRHIIFEVTSCQPQVREYRGTYPDSSSAHTERCRLSMESDGSRFFGICPLDIAVSVWGIKGLPGDSDRRSVRKEAC